MKAFEEAQRAMDEHAPQCPEELWLRLDTLGTKVTATVQCPVHGQLADLSDL